MSLPPRPPVPPRPRPASGPGGAPAAAGHKVPDALLALSRAARSVLLYDAGNATVQQHLADYEARMRAALEGHGELAIVVEPFRLLVGGEVVYSDPDREKSLAFRLFRDGVRGLRIATGVPREELLGLLEIIAVRYTGVRQQEEDAVTLLRKAEFRGIAVDYVEGFTPAEEVPEPALDSAVDRAEHQAPPPTWDTPLVQLPPPGPLEHRPVPEEAIARLRALERDDAAGELAVSVASDLLRAAVPGGWAGDRDVVAFFDDVRDGLLAEGNLAALRRTLEEIGRCGAAALRDRMQRALGHAETIELVLRSIPEAADEVTPEAAGFAPVLAGAALLDALAAAEPGRRQRLLSGLVKARLPADLDALLARLPQLPPPVVTDLAGSIVSSEPERAAELGQRLLASADGRLRIAGLALLEQAPAPPMRRLCELLRDDVERVRIRASEVLARRGDERVAAALCDALERRELSDDEAEALGLALGQAAPRAAAPLFAEWLHPKKRLIGGIGDQQRARQWAAVAGTGVMAGAEPEATLQALAEKSEGDLRKHCVRALARRRARVHGAR